MHTLINIQTAKAFRTTSSEALCVLTGTTPIIIKMEEAVKIYNARKTKASHSQEMDNTLDYKDWPHPSNRPLKTTKTPPSRHTQMEVRVHKELDPGRLYLLEPK
jgi:hypothetical protein